MPLTRDFKETVKARADRDPAFRAGLLQEALQALLDNDLPTAKILLRDFINATVGFRDLGRSLSVPEKSLMRMFGPAGNPTADHLIGTIVRLAREAGVEIKVQASPLATRTGKRREGATAPH